MSNSQRRQNTQIQPAEAAGLLVCLVVLILLVGLILVASYLFGALSVGIFISGLLLGLCLLRRAGR